MVDGSGRGAARARRPRCEDGLAGLFSDGPHLVRIEHAAVDQGPLQQDERVMAGLLGQLFGGRYLLWVSWEECE